MGSYLKEFSTVWGPPQTGAPPPRERHWVKLSLGQLFQGKFTTRPRLKFINTSDNVLELMTISLPYCHKSALSDMCVACVPPQQPGNMKQALKHNVCTCNCAYTSLMQQYIVALYLIQG